jgi:hypothetical protein
MDQEEFLIRFEGLSDAEAGEKAALLVDVVRNAAPDARADRVRVRDDAQDLGATVLLLFGAPAVVAIAKGIASFIARERPGDLVIGRVLFTGDSGDAATIAAAFAKGKRSG